MIYSKIRQILLLFVLLFPFYQLQAQIATHPHQAVVWRGFDHNWTYNHRINRLGSYICTQDSMGAISCHASASGLGADSTFYTSYFSCVENEQLGFQEGVASIKLVGKENQLLNKTLEVSIPAHSTTLNKEEYISLLNGFDIKAIKGADKLQFFRIIVDDAYYAAATNEIIFNIRVSMVFNCQSLECSRFNQKIVYDLKIYYLIIAGQDEVLSTAHKNISNHYAWDRKYDQEAQKINSKIRGDKNRKYDQAFVGIKGLAINLNKAHWMQSYRASVTPLNYSPEQGKMELSSYLFFKEWVGGMKKMSAYPKHSRFSSKKKGWAILDLDVALIQMRGGSIAHQKNSGSSFWKALNASPDHPSTLMKTKIQIPKQED